jgi:TfuA protein
MFECNCDRGDLSRVVVFTGPSLHPDRAKALISATILPPIKRGDLERVSGLKPTVVGIIDGEFYQSLAVSPKEILPLLETGVTVYGASSMGALRAVELRYCGMIGVGRVYRLFRSGVLDADDEVALAYSPSTYEAVSEPLVNTRYVLRAAAHRGMLTRAQAAEIIARLKGLYFPERTRHMLLSIVSELSGRDGALRMRQFLDTEAPNVKEDDAELLVARIRENCGC